MEDFGQWDSDPEPASLKEVKKTFRNALSKGTKGKISKLIRQRIPVRFGNLTDPFQPKEKQIEVTYRILKFLNEIDYPVILNTKGTLQAEGKYLELLKEMKVVVQETLISLDEGLLNKLEPGAPSPQERIKALDKLSDEGIPTQVRYSPIFPLLTDEPRDLFKEVAEAGVNDIITEFVRISKQKQINDALGYNYIDKLKQEGYPIERRGNFWKVKQDKMFEEYKRHKEIAEEYGLDYLICCEEKPEINSWRNCCGVDKYKGFKGMDWTIQMNGKKFKEDKVSFDEYITDTECPYKGEFWNYWKQGKLEGSLTGLKKDSVFYKREGEDAL